MKRCAAALALALAATLAAAAPIYRCGHTYSQTPCPGGRVVDTTDPRTAAQRAEARRVMAKERKLATQMERDRREREGSAPRAEASGFDSRAAAPEPAASAPAKGKKNKSGKGRAAPTERNFTAVAPAKPKSTRK
ncbi:hypothetical protein BURC_00538 [Burkholderiaceae bacterium]|nr:hypothetical protein BURC_00538 [Burkholderiaceae bacterium]